MATTVRILATLEYILLCMYIYGITKHPGIQADPPPRKAHAGHGIAGCLIICIERESYIKSSSLPISFILCITTATLLLLLLLPLLPL